MVNTSIVRTVVAFSLAILCSPGVDGQRAAPGQEAAPSGALLAGRIDFIENRGQWDGRAVFTASLGGDRVASLESGAIALQLRREPSAEVRLVFEGHSTAATMIG